MLQGFRVESVLGAESGVVHLYHDLSDGNIFKVIIFLIIDDPRCYDAPGFSIGQPLGGKTRLFAERFFS